MEKNDRYMKQYCRLIFWIGCLIHISGSGKAQDINYFNEGFSLIRVNPAATGIEKNYRVGFNIRQTLSEQQYRDILFTVCVDGTHEYLKNKAKYKIGLDKNRVSYGFLIEGSRNRSGSNQFNYTKVTGLLSASVQYYSDLGMRFGMSASVINHVAQINEAATVFQDQFVGNYTGSNFSSSNDLFAQAGVLDNQLAVDLSMGWIFYKRSAFLFGVSVNNIVGDRNIRNQEDQSLNYFYGNPFRIDVHGFAKVYNPDGKSFSKAQDRKNRGDIFLTYQFTKQVNVLEVLEKGLSKVNLGLKGFITEEFYAGLGMHRTAYSFDVADQTGYNNYSILFGFRGNNIIRYKEKNRRHKSYAYNTDIYFSASLVKHPILSGINYIAEFGISMNPQYKGEFITP